MSTSASAAIANRTARKSSVGTRSSRSLMRKNVLPQPAVIATRARVASSVVRRVPSTGATRSDQPEGDRGALREHGAGVGVDAVDEAETQVVVDVLHVDLEAGGLQLLLGVLDAGPAQPAGDLDQLGTLRDHEADLVAAEERAGVGGLRDDHALLDGVGVLLGGRYLETLALHGRLGLDEAV